MNSYRVGTRSGTVLRVALMAVVVTGLALASMIVRASGVERIPPETAREWVELPREHQVWLGNTVDPQRDWSRCKARFTDVMAVRCDDGYQVER